MSVCINKNSLEYQSLKERAGISEFTLEAVCRDFMEKYNRFPYLDELPYSNSEPHLRESLNVKLNDGIKISKLLEFTGKDTVEEAVININDLYRDLETKVLPIEEEAIIDILHRPTENDFIDNLTEEELILMLASRNENGRLLAPNGKVSNLTEKQYALVRTKAFKNWFGDWENNSSEASKVVDENGEPLVVYHGTMEGGFDAFDTNINSYRKGTYFINNKFVAEGYGDTYSVFLNIKNPNIVDFLGSNWNRNTKYGNTDKVVNETDSKLYDGVIIKNVIDSGGNTGIGTDYIVFKSNQIKSSESNSGSFNRFNRNIYDTVPDGYLVLNNALLKLASLYGITFNEITDAELNTDEWRNLIPDASSVNAFVHNGQIYINTDRADLDAPIHEMLHILVGSMRFTNPDLYLNLIKISENLNNYQALLERYPNRSRNDVNEEIFITELARYMSGMPSELVNLTPKQSYELNYHIKRVLDSILMGEDSVKTISEDRLYNMSLNDIVEEVSSSITTSKFNGFINVEGSDLHRKLNNIKSDLFKNKQLEEVCD